MNELSLIRNDVEQNTIVWTFLSTMQSAIKFVNAVHSGFKSLESSLLISLQVAVDCNAAFISYIIAWK